jgi:hypothetical protein
MKRVCWRALALCFISLGSAAESAAPKRIGVLVVAMDRRTEALNLKFEFFAAQALGEYPQFEVVRADAMFQPRPDEETHRTLAHADEQVAAAKLLFQAKRFDAAIVALRAAIDGYAKAAAAMKQCKGLCDALAMLAASLLEKHENEEAALVMMDLLALDEHFEPNVRQYSGKFFALKTHVATSKKAQLHGQVAVETRPPGARIFVDGALIGYAPHVAQQLPIGKHWIQIERPGFAVRGALIDVKPGEQELRYELQATAAYRAYDAQLDALASEARHIQGGATMRSMATTFRMEQAVIALLKDVEGSTEVQLHYVELATGRRLAMRRAVFQGDEYGELGVETMRLVRQLINSTEPHAEPPGDPLKRRQGTEEWKPATEPATGDPLKNRT